MSDVRLMRFFQLSVATAIEKHLEWMRGLLDEREREITSLRAEVKRLKPLADAAINYGRFRSCQAGMQPLAMAASDYASEAEKEHGDE